MTRARRRRVTNLAFLITGLVGLICLSLAAIHQEWLPRWLTDRVPLRYVLWIAIAHQTFWYAVRLALTLGVHRRERGLNRAQIVWMGLTAPLPVILGVWLGNGRLTAWLTEESHDERA
ncbi:MAG: hypothetical protein HYU66_06110 [Armatimonadetes bacterium]|nr:hypothetical protein [Armatimonadota bacterium]